MISSHTHEMISRWLPRMQKDADESRRSCLVKDIECLINIEIERLMEYRMNAVAKDFEVTLKITDGLRKQIKQSLKLLRTASIDILEQIQATYSSQTGIVALMQHYPESSEITLRERMVFNTDRVRFVEQSTYAETRAAVGVSDLSTVLSDDVDSVEAVLFVTSELLRWNRGVGFEITGHRKYDSPVMPVHLANVIMENHDRADDIIDYVKDRNLAPRTLDAGHLREYLAAPLVLAEGAL